MNPGTLWNTGSPAFAGDDGTACRSSRRTLLRDPSRFRRILTANLNPSIRQQHARGAFRGARHGWIASHQIGGDRAVDEKLQLRRKLVCVGDLELHQQVAEPVAAAVLEGGPQLSDSMILN